MDTDAFEKTRSKLDPATELAHLVGNSSVVLIRSQKSTECPGAVLDAAAFSSSGPGRALENSLTSNTFCSGSLENSLTSKTFCSR